MRACWMARARSSLMPCCPWRFHAPLRATFFNLPCLVDLLDLADTLVGLVAFLPVARAGAENTSARQSSAKPVKSLWGLRKKHLLHLNLTGLNAGVAKRLKPHL